MVERRKQLKVKTMLERKRVNCKIIEAGAEMVKKQKDALLKPSTRGFSGHISLHKCLSHMLLYAFFLSLLNWVSTHGRQTVD